jgi:hypothetical protein
MSCLAAAEIIISLPMITAALRIADYAGRKPRSTYVSLKARADI